MSWLPYLSVLLLLILVQRQARRSMGPAVPIGDECGYIKCGARADPYGSEQFLRVPLMAWLSKQAHGHSANPEDILRAATSIASMVSIMVSMLSAQIVGGSQAALLLGLLLVVMPGRVVLSHHIWPDIWLGLWLSLAFLCLLYPGLSPDLRTPLLGVVAALAFLTRFDALLLAPFTGIAMAPLTFSHWVVVLLPTAAVFLAWSIRNARHYGVPWPDTTWMFNCMIAAAETERQPAGMVGVEQEIQKVSAVWKHLGDRERFDHAIDSLYRLTARPVRLISGMLVRLWASLGPDHFVLHRLLPPGGHAYPGISRRFNRALTVTLRVAFPLFSGATLMALLVGGSPAPVLIWPTVALAVASLIHNRTRYRQAWLPGGALLLASALGGPDFWPKLFSIQSIVAWIAGLGLALSLIFLPVRPDTAKTP